MAEKAVKTVRVPKPEADDIDELAEAQEMSEADMYRHLIRRGLEAERAEANDATTRTSSQTDGLSLQGATLAVVVLNAVLTAALLVAV